MNASLTLGRPTRRASERRDRAAPLDLPIEITIPLGGPVAPAASSEFGTGLALTMPTPVPAVPVRSAEPRLPAERVIALRLRAAAPILLDRTSPSIEQRFCDLVVRRLGGFVEDAIHLFRKRAGEVALAVSGDQRMLVQDLALMLRPDHEFLVTEAANSLSPSEIIAILTATCEARSTGGIDALRCRDAVFDGGNLLAREAALDLAWSGLGDAPQALIDGIVSSHLLDLVLASRRLTDATRHALADRFVDVGHATMPSAAGRAADASETLDDQETLLVAALANGEDELATDLLCGAAQVAPSVLREAIMLGNAKGLVSLVWRAGFAPSVASLVQSELALMPPSQVLHPTEDGGFPLSSAEMRWQCSFLTRPAPAFSQPW